MEVALAFEAAAVVTSVVVADVDDAVAGGGASLACLVGGMMTVRVDVDVRLDWLALALLPLD